MIMTGQQAGKLRKSDSIPGIGKGVYLHQSVQIASMAHSSAYQGVQEVHSVAVKWPGRDTVYCPVRETEKKSSAIV